jgi:Inner membrane protein YgaP-like, transmembrane domain
MIKKNVGKKEGMFRIVVGLGLLALPPMFQFPVWATAVTYGIGLIALFTGITRYCPAWKLLGMNTCDRDTYKHSKT